MATPAVDLIDLRTEGSVVVARILRGNFKDEKQILSTLEKLGDVMEDRDKLKMVLDMELVEYLSSAGLGRLVALLKKAKAGGGCLHLACMREQIRELFDVMRLTQIFNIYDSVDPAIQAFDA